MNIVMILSTPLPPTEGIGFYCASLARELVRNGHGVTLVTRGARARGDHSHPDGYRIITAPFFPVYPFHVHVHGTFVQSIVDELEETTDVFHLHTPLVAPIRTRQPVLTTVHSPMRYDNAQNDVTNVRTVLGSLQTPVSVSLEKRVFAVSAKVVAVSKWVRDYLVANYTDSLSGDVDVLYNGFDSDLFGGMSSSPETRAPTVVFIGRLVQGKGLLDLVAAFRIVASRHASAELRIIGDGPLRGRVEKAIEIAGLSSRATLLGALVGSRRKELAEELRTCGVFVLPSYHEGMPTTLLEAMASGAPVVTTNATGCEELVQDEVNGRRVPVGEPSLLAEAILDVLSDKQAASKYATTGAKLARTSFAWPEVARRYIEAYQQVRA